MRLDWRFLGVLLLACSWVYACNEMTCASVVTKCLLTQSCNCTLDNCTCCKECFLCLAEFYTDCCACFDLCPRPSGPNGSLTKMSIVEDLSDTAMQSLFDILTDEMDAQKRWHSVTYPVTFSSRESDKGVKNDLPSESTLDERNEQPKVNARTANCTVTYTRYCKSLPKCRQVCTAMGASSYRWFHVGCCQCIGQNCVNYGINESRCLDCPRVTKSRHKIKYDDYGQDEDECDRVEL